MNEPNILLEVYGNTTFFRKLQSEGYREISFGTGKAWVHIEGEDSLKIDGMYAIFHPDGRVMIYPRILRMENGRKVVDGPFDMELTGEQFNDLVKKLRIQMDQREDLSDFLEE